jgi:hypothetical protein
MSEVGGSDGIGFFESGYAHENMTTGVRSGTDLIIQSIKLMTTCKHGTNVGTNDRHIEDVLQVESRTRKNICQI